MTRVLFATSEVFPLVKTGGLADVSASLPDALCRSGIDVKILLPGYPAAMAAVRDGDGERIARFSAGFHRVELWQTRLPGTAVPLWLVDCPEMFDRPGSPYQDSEGADWWDNAHRYHLFARVACMIALGEAGVGWLPELIHCNDWQTGLIPVLLDPIPNRPATVFTIHNLSYQGLFSHETFRALGLPDHLWRFDRLEFYDQLSFIKGGLGFADQLTTVSPSYAREIQSPAFGYSLDGLLRFRQNVLTGVLNGIDTRHWNPASDEHIPARYSQGDLANKGSCRKWLKKELGLEATDGQPLLGFIGRLVEQKGIDLLLQVLPTALAQGMQAVILGSGQHSYEQELLALAARFPGRIAVTLGYDEGLAHRITAGADIFVMPSRFEPCGLNQMYSLCYGTVPVVHRVGGLQDTVFDPRDVDPEEANGFCFDAPSPEGLAQAIQRAATLFRDRRAWRKLQDHGMAADYSWQQRAQTYEGIYRTALAGVRAGR
ncbi:glycogen synthase GlgA [Marinobacter profundi]|uniref:Glycogen synthase n=1 Tax=Marinobacter profundi TaxID=2666256 RepID=A0A2G1UQY7_9GAMM|nr:glycogen synthase GlgA [Marinobacter profundi]PHQ16916.1 glycogen synthase GlgA [Marinobacter profundi]